ncbi:hypothetical protein CKQ80_09560 [Pseudomonas moraviensis]|uniref:Uncharacterized protein n=1 Tax=Pseudomonas moraviensis TaxID=321662 RepID=A0A2A2PJI8_9PSED|nr:hypothetical protein [Pseudomonas moraviensis]PAW51033.1 hypothetical protein CKQ68_27395 [Pseudomonas moraviensis]PAW55543.1 hypothetical protein CKQ80_09560 [Pseudomonas moraviensis]
MQVTAKERGFYGGSIKDPGDTFQLTDKKHFSNQWMVKGTEAPAKEVPKYTGYVAARGAAGKFVVKDAAGQMVGSFTGTKAEAEAEADRLNAGGEIGGTEAPAKEVGQQDADSNDNNGGDSNGLPDA